MSKRVLITGATGALGQGLMKYLNMNSDKYIVLAPGRGQSDDSLDLSDKKQISRIIDNFRPELIFHLAATFSQDFDEAYAINVNATRHMLNAIEGFDLSTRVVLIGSAAEYGLVSSEENPIGVDRVLRPVSTYGLTKAWQTELAYVYASRGVDVVVARLFNLIGPGLSERLFIGRLHRQIEEHRSGERERIEVGSLSAVRDYISIDDAIVQLLAISDYGEAGEVYHVASGEPVTMRELLSRVLKAHGLHESNVVEGADLSNRRGYDVPAIYAEISKTAGLLKKLGNHAKH